MEQTYRIKITGLVQGVGFRPFIYRLANELKLKGEVENRNDGVYIEINTTPEELHSFIREIKKQAPMASSPDVITYSLTENRFFPDFSIVPSKNESDRITEISPDIAVCEDCLEDLKQQKHRTDYPFINCTHCGPRFTIIRDLPYDRANTTMDVFPMCDTCRNEYQNVTDRRFHAQPVACNHCGPHYTLVKDGMEDTSFTSILEKVAEAVSLGEVLAIKGLGGFHLMCDAFRQDAVEKLRKIKMREHKPFAVMCKDVAAAREIAYITSTEEVCLQSWRHPIVLLHSRNLAAPAITKGLNKIGIMLPYLPFHHLLFQKLKTSCIVLTSGNFSDEPILIDNIKALEQFKPVTDAVLINNRDIHNRCDDSVVAVVEGNETLIRRSRGYAPSPMKAILNTEGIFGAGAELVNCFALGKGNHILLSQHIGDLKNAETFDFYKETFERFSRLFRFTPQMVACDLHPDYLSSKFAKELSETWKIPLLRVQHHHAHVAACMAEHRLDEWVIGISMDGVGLGTDATIWGGEFMIASLEDFTRVYHMETIPIAGGDKVAYEPWRSAVAYTYHYFGKEGIDRITPLLNSVKPGESELYQNVLAKQINTYGYSSAGRLFDAVSALTGTCLYAGFHAEAPMRLESIADKSIKEAYSYQLTKEEITFKQAFQEIIQDRLNSKAPSEIAAKFQNTIIDSIFDISKTLSSIYGLNKVVLSGGTFQNTYILSGLIQAFAGTPLQLYFPKQVPANDGGIALGQLIIASKRRQLGSLEY